MKRSLMVFAAISAFAVPALAPVATLAQERGDRGSDDRARAPIRDGGRPGNRMESAPDSGGDRSWSPPARDTSGDRSPPQRSEPREDRGGSRPERPQEQPRPQPQPDRSGDRDRGDRDRGDRPGGWNGGSRPGADRPNRPDRPDNGRPDNGRPGGGWNGDRPGGNGSRPDNGRPNNGSGGWNNGGRPDGGRPDNGRPDNGRPNNGSGGWNGGPNRPGEWNSGGGDRYRDRDRQRQDWRNRFDSNHWQQNWNRSHRSDWWRNDNRFRGWSGVRFGFYFAPGYGYYSVPRTYYGRQFYVGDFLPSIFWRYSADYRTYGLGYPPPGTRWVYVDNSIYLIDEYDGYIIDVIRNAWRW